MRPRPAFILCPVLAGVVALRCTAAPGGADTTVVVWENERFTLPADAPADASNIAPERPEWSRVHRLLTQIDRPGGGAVRWSSLIDPSPDELSRRQARVAEAYGLLPQLSGSERFARLKHSLGGIESLARELAGLDGELERIRQRHPAPAALGGAGHQLGRLWVQRIEGLDREDLARFAPGQEAVGARLLRLAPAELPREPHEHFVGLYQSYPPSADERASPFRILVTYPELFPELGPAQLLPFLTLAERASLGEFLARRARSADTETRLIAACAEAHAELEQLFEERRFTEFVVAWRALEAVLPAGVRMRAGLQGVFRTPSGNSHAQREALISALPVHLQRLTGAAQGMSRDGRSAESAEAWREVALLSQHLWHRESRD